MTDSNGIPGQPESTSPAEEDVFFCDVSDEELERGGLWTNSPAAAYTGYYYPGSPCTTITYC